MDNFLKCLLRENIAVKHLAISTKKHPFTRSAYPENIVQRTNPESVLIDTQVKASSALAHLFKKGSYNVNRFYASTMSELINNQLNTSKFDCVILDSLFVTPYLANIRQHFNGKIYVRTHNVESDIWFTLASSTRSFFRRQYLKRLASDLQRYEIDVLKQVDGILTLSTDDQQRFIKLGITTQSVNIPVSIEFTESNEQSGKSKHFFHLGSMDWRPNIEAVDRLIKLFPRIRKQLPLAELHIAGSKSNEVLNSSLPEGLTVDGFVEDAESFARKSGILVSPLCSGSGVRIKILECMSWGVPVITTSLGALGIDYSDSKCILIANSDEEIVDACILLAGDNELREEIGRNARDYIRKNHNIESISSKIIEFIQRA